MTDDQHDHRFIIWWKKLKRCYFQLWRNVAVVALET